MQDQMSTLHYLMCAPLAGMHGAGLIANDPRAPVVESLKGPSPQD